MLTASFGKGLAAEGVKPPKVIGMHTGSPLIAREFFSSLDQAVYCRVAR
jgi:hypothetical protein